MQEYCMKGESVMITERRFKNAVKAFYNIPWIFSECEEMEKWTIRDYCSEVAYQLKKYYEAGYSQYEEYQDALETLQDCRNEDTINDRYWRMKYEEAINIVKESQSAMKSMIRFLKTYGKDAMQEKCYMRHCSEWDSEPFSKLY